MNEIDIKNTKEFQEVKFLCYGTLVSGSFHGVEYTVKISWGPDWSIDLDIISFNPKNEFPDLCFWLSHLESCSIKDVILDKLYLAPEIISFQERIDACQEIDPNLLDIIFEIMEKENDTRS